MSPHVPGTLFLIDTSALARATHKPVADIIEALIDDGAAATCLTVDLEIGYSARNPAELTQIRRIRRELYRDLPIDERIGKRARIVQALMADRGLHRAAAAMDLITAATAELHRATVLHYDADFEHIASVTGQQHTWIAPRGTLD